MTSTIFLFFPLPACLLAQRVFEKGGEVIYEDSGHSQMRLGRGFSPVLTADGKVALIRGPRVFMYGDAFDCKHRGTKNWIAVYDPVTHSEQTLFDRALPFRQDGILFCVYDQMQLSPDDSILYLVSPISTTSGSLAIVRLADKKVSYVGGVNRVYVILEGEHRGELIYGQRRLASQNRGPWYPFIHARADGRQIRVLSESEARLKAYLREIGGRIEMDGRVIP